MDKSPRGRRPLSQTEREQGRDRILAAAKSLFAENGYRSVSMRAIAQKTNMSPTSVYRFFSSKRAILVHLWGEIFARLFQDCKAAAEHANTANDALIAYAKCFVGYWVANPENYMMVYGEIDLPEKGESFFADSEKVAEELTYLATLIARAGVAEENIELTHQQFICILHGVCHSLVTIPEMGWQDADLIVTGLVQGLVGAPKKPI